MTQYYGHSRCSTWMCQCIHNCSCCLLVYSFYINDDTLHINTVIHMQTRIFISYHIYIYNVTYIDHNIVAQITASINQSIKHSHRWVNWGYSHFWEHNFNAHLISPAITGRSLSFIKCYNTHINIQHVQYIYTWH